MADNRGGKRAGAGRKPKQQSEALAELLDSVWKVKDRKRTLEMLVQDSISPHPAIRQDARKLLLAYAFGKPIERQQIESNNTNHNVFDVNEEIEAVFDPDEVALNDTNDYAN